MTLPELPPSTLRLQIDKGALAHNWRELDRLSGTARAGAAVKASCYGLGVDHVVPVLEEAGARDFFVAHWAEVPAVMQHVPAECISVLHGPLGEADIRFAKETGARPVINSLYQARLWRDAGGGPCDVMVDTGMNRLGLSMAEIGEAIVSDLQIHTLISHLASADEDVALNALQLERFTAAAQQVPAQCRSLANSAGIALGASYAFDLTRPGLALYGGIPHPGLAGRIRQVACPQAQVLQLRDLSPGDTVGYNATFTARRAMRSATVSLGYADGFLRSWAKAGMLMHNGTELPILGRVSMDLVIVDCGAASQLREGDWLDLEYDLPRAAQLSGLSQYELLTLLGRRFCRTA
ncbi:alanine racemase [Altererythrobacter atlanticus]|uniref:alanine racemase n=1 Tax=Croceibacterium atlanticum TaxID=1267766 RepID=A0A0F7KQX3_9SPHN|nr:alanine racemase [Croceibacterium atlanticum]AKH41587.1 Alanine racemase [Croceibacterium atlanticum]MBB5733049.1 alanine racemase [Croceibacterium atlanticum]